MILTRFFAIFLLLISGFVFAAPEKYPDLSIQQVLSVINGSKTLEVNGYRWKASISEKNSGIKVVGVSSEVYYPSEHYLENPSDILKLPIDRLSVILANKSQTIDLKYTFYFLAQYYVKLSGNPHYVGAIIISEPVKIVPTMEAEAKQ